MSKKNKSADEKSLILRDQTGQVALRRARDMLDLTAEILGTELVIPKPTSTAVVSSEPDQKDITLSPDQGPYGREFRDPVTGMEFVWIPPGSFEMGDTFGDEEYDDEYDDGYEPREQPVHTVTLEGFYLGKYAVTRGEWVQIMGYTRSSFRTGDRYPVECVSWDGCQEFIQKLNQQSGFQYSLPSEAQWEYAAREGGKKVRFGTGKDTIGSDEANFNAARSDWKVPYSRVGEYRGKTVPVDAFSPNALGLYNMSGNVWEWCQDRWHDDYSGAPVDGSAWESEITNYHVVRGGCLYSAPERLQASCRDGFLPDYGDGNLGFRLALPVHQTKIR